MLTMLTTTIVTAEESRVIRCSARAACAASVVRLGACTSKGAQPFPYAGGRRETADACQFNPHATKLHRIINQCAAPIIGCVC